MIEWSALFETHIDLVDQQHKMLFEMLNGITREIEQGQQSSKSLDEAIDELLDYAYQHFIDEEKILANSHVHPTTMSLQRMEPVPEPAWRPAMNPNVMPGPRVPPAPP